MKKNKIKLNALKVKSFVTEQKAELKGGYKDVTVGYTCVIAVYSEQCKPSWDCVKSLDIICDSFID